MNRIRTRILMTLAAGLLLAACGSTERHAEVSSFHVLAFGTLIEVTLADASPEQIREAETALNRDFQLMHEQWHAWDPSPLTQVNAAIAAEQSITLPEPVAQLLPDATRLAVDSDHLFNPAIGGLLQLWGFQSDQPATRPPDNEQIRSWVERAPRMTDLTIADGQLRSDNPYVQLDFGAFGKGVGIDRAVDRLRVLGINNAIVNAGGDLRAIGHRGERGWRVGIRSPRASGIFATLEVDTDESVFTSGDYERYFEYQGRRYGHILDPRSGYPVDHTLSVTVIHPDASTADAAATALFVAGPADWARIATAMGIRYALLVDADGGVHMNPAMAQRVEFMDEPDSVTIRPLPASGD